MQIYRQKKPGQHKSIQVCLNFNWCAPAGKIENMHCSNTYLRYLGAVRNVGTYSTKMIVLLDTSSKDQLHSLNAYLCLLVYTKEI